MLGQIDFRKPGYRIRAQKTPSVSSVTSNDDSKRCKKDFKMIFVSSERWHSIFFKNVVTQPPTEPQRLPFYLDLTTVKSVSERFLGGHLRLRSPRAPSGAPYKHLKSWTHLSSDISHDILLIFWRNSCYILKSYGILRFCTGSWWYMGIWGLRRGLQDLKNFTIEKYRQKSTKKSIIIF